MILLIDNYDSFTYNLFQFMSELGAEVEVVRNDRITLAEIVARRPQKIVISPGPCTPLEAGISNDIIRHMGREVPILGVCLGHQCIGQVFGATVAYAGEIMHGKTSKVTHDNAGVFTGLPNPLEAIRYHSLAVVPETVPSELDITAWSDTGVIMGLRHKTLPIEGIQFHPESIMTENGKDLLSNFLTR
jgi:anthranilate synthase/aminodeoxychorismate synthase-like glutamine amidotransferase